MNKKGDCEDYALTKKQLLEAFGIPKEELEVFVVYYKNNWNLTQTHTVLVYKDEWVLDNRTDIIWRKRQAPYTGWTKDFKMKDIYNGKP